MNYNCPDCVELREMNFYGYCESCADRKRNASDFEDEECVILNDFIVGDIF